MNAIVMPALKDHHIGAASIISGATSVVDTAVEQMTTAAPLKPSAAMLAAGSRAGGVSVEIAWKIYLAMVREAA